ncbi:CD209 antigen-like protein E isoform X1 [Alosa alosa]|uniref:CD209 antigen-like protein E isoform X1 n=2 Tax=Alosa alosa TaxID=278164 RepID=UPI0020155086|nr:CD209 antigen-like protein E isoform X1 [Alosa alosa]
MDQIYGNVDVPAVGNYSGEDPSDYYSNIPESGSSLSKATDRPCPVPQPHGSGAEEKVSTSRVVPMLPLALGLGLLLTLPALIAVAHLYVTGQAKLNLIENLHRNLSATLNITASSGCRVCPDAWAHHNGKCYFFSSSGKNWKQSQDHCVTLGGHLVIVNNQEEQTFLSKKAKGEFHWIGLSDLETEGQWIWVDNTPLDKTGPVFWMKRPEGQDEPDNWKVEDPAGEHCACLSDVRGEWHDNSCRKTHKFVCETLAPK